MAKQKIRTKLQFIKAYKELCQEYKWFVDYHDWYGLQVFRIEGDEDMEDFNNTILELKEKKQ